MLWLMLLNTFYYKLLFAEPDMILKKSRFVLKCCMFCLFPKVIFFSRVGRKSVPFFPTDENMEKYIFHHKYSLCDAHFEFKVVQVTCLPIITITDLFWFLKLHIIAVKLFWNSWIFKEIKVTTVYFHLLSEILKVFKIGMYKHMTTNYVLNICFVII